MGNESIIGQGHTKKKVMINGCLGVFAQRVAHYEKHMDTNIKTSRFIQYKCPLIETNVLSSYLSIQ